MVGAPRKLHGIIRNATRSISRFLEGRLGTALRDFKLPFKHSILGRSQQCDGSHQVECIFFLLSIGQRKLSSILSASPFTKQSRFSRHLLPHPNLRQFIIWPINRAFRTERFQTVFHISPAGNSLYGPSTKLSEQRAPRNHGNRNQRLHESIHTSFPPSQ